MVKKVRLDFSKTEERSGWNSKHMPEGIHKFKIASVEDSEAPDGTPMWIFALVPTEDRFKTRRFPFYCKLQQNQLWKVRDLFVAAGVPVPKKAVTLDPNKVVGKFIAGEVGDGTGQYADRSEVNGTYGLELLEDDADAGDAPDDEDEEYEGDEEADEAEDEEEGDEEEYEEDEEEEEEEDLEALTLPELKKRAKGLGIDIVGLKKPDIIEAILEEEAEEDDESEEDELDDDDLEDEDLADEEFEDDEEEEEEEAPAPKPRRTAAKKAAPAKAKPAAKAAPAKRVVRRR